MFVGLQRRGAVEFDIANNNVGNIDHLNTVSDRGPNDASATTWSTDDTCDGSAPP